MRSRSLSFPRVAAGAAVAGVLLVGIAEPAHAWPIPLTAIAGGACRPDGTRAPTVIVVTNLETEFPNSPAVIDNVHKVPAFANGPWSPELPIANTGAGIATSNLFIPSYWTGTFYLTYRMFWDGPDGSDIRVGSAQATFDYCFGPDPVVAAGAPASMSIAVTGRMSRRLRLRG